MANNNPNRFTTTVRRKSSQSNDISAIILGGRVEYGMKSNGPKSIIKLPDGTKLIDKLVENILSHYQNTEIMLTIGYEADKVIRQVDNVRLVENQMYEHTNHAEEIRLALNSTFCTKLLVMTTNIIFSNECMKNICGDESFCITDNTDMLSRDSLGVTIVDDKINMLCFGLPDNPKWCQISYFTGRELEILRRIVSNRDNGKMFLSEIINKILSKNNTNMKSFQIKGDILKLNSMSSLSKIDRKYL